MSSRRMLPTTQDPALHCVALAFSHAYCMLPTGFIRQGKPHPLLTISHILKSRYKREVINLHSIRINTLLCASYLAMNCEPCL